MSTTTAYYKWIDRIESGVLTKSEISQFGLAVTRRAMGYAPHGRRTNLATAQAEALVKRLQLDPVRLTDPHTDQGITWFANHAAKALDMSKEQVLDIVSNFSHFTWDGAVDNGTLPIWTVHLTDGRILRYFNGAWQDHAGETSWWWVREHAEAGF